MQRNIKRRIFMVILIALCVLIIRQLYYEKLEKQILRIHRIDFENQNFSKVSGNDLDTSSSSTFEIDNCQCSRTILISNPNNITSTCSYMATNRGLGQNVLSFGLAGTFPCVSRYTQGVIPNIENNLKMYPGYNIRIYSDWSYEANESYRQIRCDILCTYSHVDWCDVRKITNLQKTTRPILDHHVGVWRFLPIGDPTVNIVHFRDLDQLSGNRELAAVKEWELLGKKYHAMRDFQWHGTPILAGMWGFRSHNIYEELNLREIIFNSKQEESSHEDQYMARDYLWDIVKNNVTAHDSFFCTEYGQSLPFPTQRDNRRDVIGQYVYEGSWLIADECPEICRPKEHQDWIYC